MDKEKNLLQKINEDEKFLELVHWIEKIVAKVLSLALIFIVIVSLGDLVVYLAKYVFSEQAASFFNKTLIELFGLFLNILIALELLENIIAYLRKNVIHVELVLVTSLIAVARKIIIFDSAKKDSDDLIALGFAILCLSISYVLVRLTRAKK
ncbi:MAG: phosphate-starvation-inducible PsiE family protein [Xenococcus sp. (in: cyanobacteria)]